jgi:DNA-directed RNA polymerase subunit F
MALFRYLNDDAFLIFSRKFRFLYEAALLDIYDRFFSRGANFPTPQEVVHAIYDVIKAKPEYLADGDDVGEGLPDVVSKFRRRIKFSGSSNDAGEAALKAAGMVYLKLLHTGWLEEEEYGLRVTVDMPMGASLVIQRLSSLKTDVSQRFGGVVVNVKHSLELAYKLKADSSAKDREEAAYSIRQAREQAEQFSKTMRAILSDLRRIRRTLMASKTMRERVDTYFEQFIGELVLKDFQAIHTFNHPYRFKDKILDLARDIAMDFETLHAVSEGYASTGMAPDAVAGRRAAETDLISIQEVFDAVSEMFERIATFRRQLETRLRNTVKYAEQGGQGIAPRAAALIQTLHRMVERRPAMADHAWIPAGIEDMRTPWSERHLYQPRQVRVPVVETAVPARVIDPEMLRLKGLRDEYRARVRPSPERIISHLREMVRPGTTTEARFWSIGDIDGFLLFDAIRLMRKADELPPDLVREFAIEDDPRGDEHDSEWLRCGNFLIRRRALNGVIENAG